MDRVQRTSLPDLPSTAFTRPPVAGGFGRPRMPAATEWPTILIAAAIYGCWLAGCVAAGFFAAPAWIWAPILAWAAAWHASLQHEVIHGHPTPRRWVNRLIAGPPLLIWLPFARYRDSHLRHHVDDRLTDPLDDPESWYVSASAWRSASLIERGLRLLMNTLPGRLVCAPPWLAALSVRQDARDLLAGRCLGALASHYLQVAAILVVLWVSGIPIWLYLLTVAWPATSLLALRTYAEHRPAQSTGERSVIVESTGPLGLLYLSNNLHAVHHERPGLPWYALGKVYRGNRRSVLERNGGYRFASYAAIARRYLLSMRDHPVHPDER